MVSEAGLTCSKEVLEREKGGEEDDEIDRG